MQTNPETGEKPKDYAPRYTIDYIEPGPLPFPIPKVGLVSGNVGPVYMKVDFKLISLGMKELDLGRLSVVECGRETLSNLSIRQSYEIIEFPYHLSWEQSKDIVA